MRHAQRGKLSADTLVALTSLVFCVAFFGFLFFGPRWHKPSHRDMEQKVQLNALNAAAELFANEFDGYPPSDANDPAGRIVAR